MQSLLCALRWCEPAARALRDHELPVQHFVRKIDKPLKQRNLDLLNAWYPAGASRCFTCDVCCLCTRQPLSD